MCRLHHIVWSGIYECNEYIQIDDLTAGVGVSYDPLTHSSL